MASNKKPKRKYKPKKNLIDPVTWVLAGIKPFKEVSASIDIRIKNHAAMDALRLGKATKADMDVLIGAFNMTEAYMKLRPDLGSDWAKEIGEGQDALLAVARRGVKSGRFILKSQELVAMNLVMELHDAQLDQTTVRDMELAMDIIGNEYKARRMRAVQEVIHEDSAGTQRAVAVQQGGGSGGGTTEAKTETKEGSTQEQDQAHN